MEVTFFMEQFNIEKEIGNKLGQIKRMCRKFLYDKDESELLFSGVLEKIWVNRDKFFGDESQFNAWSYMVVKNLFISEYRVKKKLQQEDISLIDDYSNYCKSSFDFVDDFENKELLDSIRYTVGFLKPAQIQMFKLRFEQGLKYEEIAKEIGLPSGTVRTRIHHLKKFLLKKSNIKNRPDFVKK